MRSFEKCEVTLNAFPKLVVIKTSVLFVKEVCFIFLIVRNHCGLYQFLLLHNLSRSD
jgi:hypothetical protein